MANKNKTKPTEKNVEEFLSQIEPAEKQEDCRSLCKMMQEITGEPPVMWGTMVGFGQYHYRYDSGREGDMFLIGFAPRARNISVYGAAYDDSLDQKKEQLGKVTLGKSCIYISKLKDVNLEKLRKVLEESIQITLARYPQS